MPQLFYRRNLPHFQRDSKTHFLTFCTYKRWVLPAGARSIVLDACIRGNGRTIDLLAAIVMPDHAHMIFVPRTDQKNCEIFPLARITKAIKGSSSHLIKQQFKRTEAVWQEESFDHVLRSSEKLDEKISYVLYNPVRSGLVSRPEDYRWLWARPELIL